MLTAINKVGKRVYYDNDAASGGYPWWNSSFNNRTYDSLSTIPSLTSGVDYMRSEVSRIEVLEVEIRAKVVESTELVSEIRARAMAEIAKIEKELARKVAMLEGTK